MRNVTVDENTIRSGSLRRNDAMPNIAMAAAIATYVFFRPITCCDIAEDECGADQGSAGGHQPYAEREWRKPGRDDDGCDNGCGDGQ
jgi:hypothetical protein